MLDRFAIDFALCMYCGICIEVCPFDALFWSPEFEYSEYDIRDLTHEKERLREWMYTVPAPPVLDPDGAPAAELVAAEKAEPKVYEAPSLGGAVAAPTLAPAAAAPAAAPAAAAPAEAPAPAATKPQREHAEIAKDDVGIDQAVFDAAVASGMSERQARAKAKSAWMKQWKKTNALAPEAAPAAPPAPPAEAPAAEAAPEPEAPAPAPEPPDVGEPQIDQEVYDAAIAEGMSDRQARAKAKSAWIKKARKAAGS
jgi:NADH-quinone oxidoreductase subunit I